jgi:hypothetical protein
LLLATFETSWTLAAGEQGGNDGQQIERGRFIAI